MFLSHLKITLVIITSPANDFVFNSLVCIINLMDDIEQPRPDLTASVELQDRLSRIANRPVRDIVYVDEYDLREISSRAYRAGEADKAKVRPVLKRVMLGSVPWARGAKYVREQLYDLAYSPQEISVLNE